MADGHDMLNAERTVEQALGMLDDERPMLYNFIMGITAITNAILAVGVRLDYVLRDLAKDRRVNLQ